MGTWCLERSGGSIRLGWITDSCEPPHRWWEPNPNPLGEEPWRSCALNHGSISPAPLVNPFYKKSLPCQVTFILLVSFLVWHQASSHPTHGGFSFYLAQSLRLSPLRISNNLIVSSSYSQSPNVHLHLLSSFKLQTEGYKRLLHFFSISTRNLPKVKFLLVPQRLSLQ